MKNDLVMETMMHGRMQSETRFGLGHNQPPLPFVIRPQPDLSGAPALIFPRRRLERTDGRARRDEWVLRFERQSPPEIEPLMGWTSSRDTRQQLRLWFDTKEEAIAYAQREGITYRVEEPHEMKRRTVSYSDNFKFNRVEPWTH